MKHFLLFGFCCVLPLSACAQTLATVEVMDRQSGQVLPQYWHDGRAWIVGEPGHEYRVTVSNSTSSDVLAVVSVDGVNVVSGETADPSQTGYVIDAYSRQAIDGWRKSLNHTAAFYFTPISDSYAARTGRPNHVGVIGAALFRRERMQRYDELARNEDRRSDATKSSESAAGSSAPAQREQSLGTGHGRVEGSNATHVSFKRATAQPEQRIAIWYDSYENLRRRGIISAPVDPQPNPFPGTFVPDPR